MKQHRNFSLENIVAEIDGVTYVEEWKSINESTERLEISSFGRLKRLPKQSKEKAKPDKIIVEKILAGVLTKKGYIRFSFKIGRKMRSRYAHRLVAIAFILNPEKKPCVNHKTAIKTDNHYSQLEWCTDEENNKHAQALGLFEGANSKIPKEQRKYIKENFFTVGRKKLAEMFGLTEEYVLTVSGARVSGTNQRKKNPPRFNKVINIVTCKVYPSVNYVSLITGLSVKHLHRALGGERYNKTPYRYFIKGNVINNAILPPNKRII